MKATQSAALRSFLSPAALGAALMLVLPLAARAMRSDNPCKKSASAAKDACKKQASADYQLARAKCFNLPTPQERLICLQAASADYHDAKDECGEQYSARRDLCERLGGGFYAPVIDPNDFVPVIDNAYWPLAAGTTFVYEGVTSEGLEHVEFIVTHTTKVILGVTCTVVHDIASLDGVVVEDTFDWFAQDVAGNIWYFGELSFEYENGEIVGMGGSWEAGVDGAIAGIVMEAAPVVGDVYRQEFAIGEAEDSAAVLSLTDSVTVPFGVFTNCLTTEDFTPIEPDFIEHKSYAAGVGLVLEVNIENGERIELIQITSN